VRAIRATLAAGNMVALVHSPTGSGKSYMIAEFIRQMLSVSPKARFLIIVPKVKLVEQIAKTLTCIVGKRPSIYCASLNAWELGGVTVGTFQSLCKAQECEPFDVIIADEAHRVSVERISPQLAMIKRMSHQRTRVVGFTATPFRGSIPLWRHSSGFWPEPCFKIGIEELTKKGLLAPARMAQGKHAHSTKGFRVVAGEWSKQDLNSLVADTEKTKRQVQDALEHIAKHNRKSVIWLCIDQAHARQVDELLKSFGETSSLVISDQADDERSDSFAAYVASGSKHLVSVEIAKEGFDDKKTDCVVFLKATRSITSYLQAAGRALRVCEGKEYALILDYGDVVKNCGTLDRPFIDWTGSEKQDSQAARARIADDLGYSVVACQECGSFFFPCKGEPKDCPVCGANNDDEKTKKLREQAASGELYSSHDAIGTEFSRFHVLDFEGHINDDGMRLEMIVRSMALNSAVAGRISLFFFAPYGRDLNKWEINRVAHTKRWLSKAFGLPADLSAREMMRRVFNREVRHVPQIIVQATTNIGYMIESVRPLVSPADLQENIFDAIKKGSLRE
jgi:superfamily II DNA or RNA helicase